MASRDKAYDHFRARIKAYNIRIGEIFFMSGTSGWTVPSGVLIYNTTSNKLILGTGGTSPETVTSSA